MTRQRVRKHLRPTQFLQIYGIDGENLYYGPDRVCDVLNFGHPISRIGTLQGLTVVQTLFDVFVVIPTGDGCLPWVFEKVLWLDAKGR